jgi:molybdopterin/thiamine biosynthesis adenylyltransferase
MAGIVSDDIHGKHVVFVGCSGVADLALKFVRMGLRTVSVVDFDTVDLGNIPRTAFALKDIGEKKVDAFVAHARRVHPSVAVRAFARDVTTMVGARELGELLGGADLLIAATDSFAAQAYANRLSTMFRIPLVAIGIHEGGKGGMVIWSMPGETACYRCVAKNRYEAAASAGPSSVDLPGAPGLMVDIAFIDAVAAKVAIAILERDKDSQYARFFSGLAGRNQIVVRTDPTYGWDDGVDPFAVVLDDLPTEPKDFKAELKRDAYFACDSLWLRTEVDPDCPDCGQLWRRSP